MTDFEKIFQQKYTLTENNTAQREAVDTIDGPVLVIAGPGTGKTQLLSTRIANILRQTDATPDSILAMTFTEAGARNMRERLSTMIGTDAHKVAIFTYHGFTNHIIQRYREFFLDKNLENTVEGLTQKKIIREIIENLPGDSLVKKTTPLDALSVIGELKKSNITPADLETIARENIRQQEAFHKEIEGLRIPSGKGSRNPELHIEAFYQPILEALVKHNTSSEIIEGRGIGSNLGFYIKGLVEAIEEVKNAEKPSTKPLTNWKNAHLDHKDKFDNFQIKDTITNLKLLDFVEIFRNYQTRLEAEGLYDFDDMILQVIEALQRHDELRFALQEKYQYILLDEYQDTNETQARLIELISDNPANNGRPNILAVGDDDQAIMAFQGAGKANMQDFYRRFRPEDIKVINLTKNYRSHGDILESAKKVAETIGGRLTKNLPIQIEKDITAEGNFENKESGIFRADFASQMAEFAWVADKISKLIASGVDPSEIAILSPKHKFLESVAPYLAHRNVPIHYEKRENILEAPIVKRILNISKLILAIRDKNDTTMNEVFPEVMSYDFWRIPATEIYKISWHASDNRDYWISAILASDNPSIKNLGQLLIEIAKISHEATFEEVFDIILGTTPLKITLEDGEEAEIRSPIREYINALNDQAKLDTISTLTVIRDNLREFSKQENNSLEDIIAFADLYADFGEKIINTNPHGSSDDAVQLMTAFASKGLEFEHVFLLSTTNSVWNSEKGGGKGGIKMPFNLKFTNIEDEGADTRKRLLFVAMTRAKTHLYLTSFSKSFSGKNESKLEFFDEREGDDKQLRTHILPQKYQVVNNFETEAPSLETAQTNWHDFYQPTSPEMRELLSTRLQSYHLSPTHLNSYFDLAYGGPSKFFENTILRFPSAYTESAATGTLVHDGMSWIQNKINQGETPTLEGLKLRLGEKIEKSQFSASDKSVMTARIDKIFENIFAEKMKIFESGNISERGFSNAGVTVGDARLTGNIDLIKIDENSKRITVVDFKTGKAPITATGKFKKVDSDPKLHKYVAQLYFYKILIEGAPEFAGYTVDGGVLEFIEPDDDGRTYTFEMKFDPSREAEIKTLIQALWARIMAGDFADPDESEFSKDLKGSLAFEAAVATDFEK